MKTPALEEAWHKRKEAYARAKKFREAGEELRASGQKFATSALTISAEGMRQMTKGNLLYGQGCILAAESNHAWVLAVLKEYGDIQLTYADNGQRCTLENGDIYE
jgi:hypothetical protein